MKTSKNLKIKKMKKILLILSLVIIALPGISQTAEKAREKKHTPGLSFLRQLPEANQTKKMNSRFSVLEAGSLSIKNNAAADSMLVYSSDFKGNWDLIAKELPQYIDETFMISELEAWFTDGEGGYYDQEKIIAAYDDSGKLNRIEAHFWNGSQWEPSWAEEMTFDPITGEELFYGWYEYDENAADWDLIYGYRANDQYDNDMLAIRVWEYYSDSATGWQPEQMDEYLYDENNKQIGFIISVYQDNEWELESMVVFKFNDNNEWESGFSYLWDSIAEDWIEHLKYVDMQWHNFESQEIGDITIMMNEDIWEEKSKEEPEWFNFMRIQGMYTQDGLMENIIISGWNYQMEHWYYISKNEFAYDHFQNIIFEGFSNYEGGSDEWILDYGYKIDMEYNDDQSIKSFDVNIASDEWKNKLTPIFRYEYFYTKDYTSIPAVNIPGQMTVYPNPASSFLNMVWAGTDENISITVMGIDGKVIISEQHNVFDGQLLTLDISKLKDGMYIITGQGRETLQVARFMKK